VAIGTDNKHVADDLEAIANTFRLLDSDTYEDALVLIADDFEMATPADIASEPSLYRGPEGVRRWWESFLEAMESVRLEILETHPVDDNRLILEFEIQARGRSSGIESSQRAVGLATARDRMLTRLEFFSDLEQAREAAGLQPS
jgi:ketosteroid isomerase-like protein